MTVGQALDYATAAGPLPRRGSLLFYLVLVLLAVSVAANCWLVRLAFKWARLARQQAALLDQVIEAHEAQATLVRAAGRIP